MKAKLDRCLPNDTKEKIQSAMNVIVSRHNALRMTISSCTVGDRITTSPCTKLLHEKSVNFQLAQKLKNPSKLDICTFKHTPLTSCNCGTSKKSAQVSCITCAIREEIFTLFDMAKQLFRCTVFSPSSEEIVICLVFHHIITDGMSLFVLTNELLSLLRDDGCKKEELHTAIGYYHDQPTPPTLTLSNSQSLQQTPASKAKMKSIEKWIALLSTAEKCLNLWSGQHGKHISNAKQPHSAGDVFLELPHMSSQSISYLSQTYHISPAVIIATVYCLALHYFTGESDIVIGMVSANRSRATTNEVGYFANTLPLRVNLNSPHAEDMKSLLKDVRRNWSMILAGGIDLSDLVPLLPCLQHSSSGRELSTVHSSPLQVLFSFYDVGEEISLPKELTIASVEVDCKVNVPKPGHSHADLWMEFNPNYLNKNGHPVFHWEYRKCILTHSMVESIHLLLCRYLEAASDAIGKGAEHANLLQLHFQISTSHLSQVDGSDFPRKGGKIQDTSHLCYIQRFEQKAQEIPHSPAFKVDNNGLVYTYSEVKSMVAAIAVFLNKTFSVKPGDHVALFLPRNVNLYLVLLSVLKCGAAYVPVTVDVTLPDVEERLTKTLKVAETKVLLTLKSMWRSLPRNIGCVGYLDEMMANLEHHRISNLSRADFEALTDLEATYSPQLLFYILLTSGTTGEPKAVGITNANLDTTFNNFLHLLSPEETKLTLAATGINFDSHILDSLAPLLNGACLVVAKNALDLANEGEAECDFNDSGISCMSTSKSSFFEGITFSFATPSTASVVDYPSSMRAIMIGGEVFTRACYVNTKHIPRVLNIYGPTECSVFMTAIEVPKQVSLPGENIKNSCDHEEISRIGWPLPQVKVMILNDAKYTVPVGRIGELHIAGPVVSSIGYLNSVEKTDQSFFPNPLDPSEMIYATGDLMYMQPNHMLQFVGRKDGQVKLRGMRIHLQEITNALTSHPDVKYATSLVLNPSTSSATLISFVTPKKVDKSSLLKYAKSHLPPHMIPSVIISDNELINYKLSKDYIYKRALKALEEETSHNHEIFCENPILLHTASVIAALFERVLDVQDYPVKGDFFAFGGHSLLCFQLLKEINQAMHTRLSLTHIIHNPTPMDLASVVMELKSTKHSQQSLHSNCVDLQMNSLISISNGKRCGSDHSTTCIALANEFDYLEPVPTLPLSTDLESKLALVKADKTCGDKLNEVELLRVSNLLAQETGFYIPPDSLIHYDSLEILQAHLKLKTVHSFTSHPQKVVVTLQPSTSSDDKPIFFLHSGVIGWSISYVKLARKIGSYSIAIQRTPEATTLTSSFEEMVAFYLKEILSIQRKGPYRLVGVCYGAYVVYEVMRQLTEMGEKVDLAVLINNSPVNECRPAIFNENRQPLPNTMAHPVYFFERTLKLKLNEDVSLREKYNRAEVEVDMLAINILELYPWLPFSAEELGEAYFQFIKTLKPAWFGYVPKSIKHGKLVRRVVLIRNQVHPFFKSHDYGLLELLNDSELLQVIVSPRKLGLLNEEHTVQFISDKIKQNLVYITENNLKDVKINM